MSPGECVRALCGTGFGVWMPWAYREQVGRPKFAPDSCSPTDPCIGKLTRVLFLPRSTAELTHATLSTSCASGQWEGGNSAAGEKQKPILPEARRSEKGAGEGLYNRVLLLAFTCIHFCLCVGARGVTFCFQRDTNPPFPQEMSLSEKIRAS